MKLDKKILDELHDNPGMCIEVIPEEDYKKHVEILGDVRKTCWCNPVLVFSDEENSNEVWNHNLTH